MKTVQTVQATMAAAVWMAATAATNGYVAPAYADPPVGPCDPQQLTVTAGRMQSGLGHRAVQLNFTLQPGASSCQLTGYPTVDAQVDADGASPVHAEQTSGGYMAGAVPLTTVILDPGHGARAMVEWVASATRQDPNCPIYGPAGTDVRLGVTPPGTSQAFSVPISIERNEGLCSLQVHPLTT